MRGGKRKVIQSALGRLGGQANNKDVMALLASMGIEVSEGLVGRVKLETLKKVDEAKMKQARLNQMARERRTTGIIKLPQRRTYYR
jgi:uncharacterized Fe-S cluster-containing protein